MVTTYFWTSYSQFRIEKYFMADKSENPAMTKFYDYLVDNYTLSNDSIFLLTDACESFHTGFN